MEARGRQPDEKEQQAKATYLAAACFLAMHIDMTSSVGLHAVQLLFVVRRTAVCKSVRANVFTVLMHSAKMHPQMNRSDPRSPTIYLPLSEVVPGSVTLIS